MFPEVTKAGDLAKLAAEHYTNLSENEKAVYEEKYKVLKQEYMEKMRLHKQYFPGEDPEKPKKKRGRPPKVKTQDNVKPKKPKNIPQKTSDVESESDCEEVEFTILSDSNTGNSYSVDLKNGLYYDIKAPWGKSLGTYDSVTNTFSKN